MSVPGSLIYLTRDLFCFVLLALFLQQQQRMEGEAAAKRSRLDHQRGLSDGSSFHMEDLPEVNPHYDQADGACSEPSLLKETFCVSMLPSLLNLHFSYLVFTSNYEIIYFTL